MSPALTKIDAARRQLATAIRLFFDRGDSVSVFSLAANAWEVVDALCLRSGVASMSVQTRGNLATGKDLKKDYINSPFRNFFKHADRDPDAVLADFDESAADGILFLAVEDYIRLRGKSPVELQVFQIWYLACHTEKVARDRQDVFDAIARMFPDIEAMPREQRLCFGRRVLDDALQDEGVRNDPKTEPAYQT